MRARYHVVVSAGVSAGLLIWSKSYLASLACFLSGVLIDLDHYWDYYITNKKWPSNYQALVDYCLKHQTKKVFLFFHSYEFLFLLWLSISLFNLNEVWVGFALGLTIHMFFDQFTNPIKPLFYFLVYRIKNRFEISKLITTGHTQGMG